eukprot:3086826-Pyramimonas_sp.AAC.1
MRAVLSASLRPCSRRHVHSLWVAATVVGIACSLLPALRVLMSSNRARVTGLGISVVPVEPRHRRVDLTALATLLECLGPARTERSAYR